MARNSNFLFSMSSSVSILLRKKHNSRWITIQIASVLIASKKPKMCFNEIDRNYFALTTRKTILKLLKMNRKTRSKHMQNITAQRNTSFTVTLRILEIKFRRMNWVLCTTATDWGHVTQMFYVDTTTRIHSFNRYPQPPKMKQLWLHV